jgi:hypothetical protein
MRQTITDGGPGTGFWLEFEQFQRSAWRWEAQPSYWIGYETEQFDDFLSGDPKPANENPDLRDWFAQVHRQTHLEGKTVGRVRVVNEPITEYQQWMRWMDHWNRQAGETIQYLSRAGADQVGLIAATGATDWWLFDDERLMLMHFDDTYRRVKVEVLVDEPEVEQARRWRALAIATANAEMTK